VIGSVAAGPSGDDSAARLQGTAHQKTIRAMAAGSDHPLQHNAYNVAEVFLTQPSQIATDSEAVSKWMSDDLLNAPSGSHNYPRAVAQPGAEGFVALMAIRASPLEAVEAQSTAPMEHVSLKHDILLSAEPPPSIASVEVTSQVVALVGLEPRRG
jgi:hypothetical protein